MDGAESQSTGVYAVTKHTVVANRSVLILSGTRICGFVAGFRTVPIAVAAKTRISEVLGTKAAHADIRAVAKQIVIAGRRVVQRCTDTATVADVVRADVAVILTRRKCRRKVALLERFVAYAAAETEIQSAGIAVMNRTGPAKAGIGAVAEQTVVTRRRVRYVRTAPRSVAKIVRARISVVHTGRTGAYGALIADLIAGTCAFSEKRTGIPGVDTASTGIAGIRAVAEHPVVAGVRIVWMDCKRLGRYRYRSYRRYHRHHTAW